MSLELTVQRATAAATPDDETLRRAGAAALSGRCGHAQLCIRIVDEAEGGDLNQRYRGGCGATNVLSFGYDVAAPGQGLLGDLVLCAPVVAREAGEQGKDAAAHWSHLVVHGVLHLLGYDHIADDEAETMQAQECAVLATLGIADPYQPESVRAAGAPG